MEERIISEMRDANVKLAYFSDLNLLKLRMKINPTSTRHSAFKDIAKIGGERQSIRKVTDKASAGRSTTTHK